MGFESFLPNFATKNGRKTLAEAQQTRAKLTERKTEKGLLKGRDMHALQEAQGVTRRDFVKNLLWGLGVVGTGTGVVLLNRNPEQKAALEKDALREKEHGPDDEKALDLLITRIENEFPALKMQLEENIKRMGGLPPDVKEVELFAPFQAMDINKKNPNKNKKKLLRENPPDEHGETRLKLQDHNYFSYDFTDSIDSSIDASNYIAFFAPVARTMHLDPNINPSNPFDALVLYHEIRHATQDAFIRAHIGSQEEMEAYLAQFRTEKGARPKMVITDELTAYAYEIEALNILSRDRLRQGMRLDDIAESLGVPGRKPHQILTMMHELSMVYYPNGMKNGVFADNYAEMIIAMYAKAGYEIYAPTQDGNKVRVR